MASGVLGIVIAVAFAALALGAREVATVVTVNPSQTYQVMKGWEVVAGLNFWDQGKNLWVWDKRRAFRYRDLIFDHLLNELAINRVRIEIHSGAENPVDYWTLIRQNIISYSCPDHHRYREIEIEDRVQAAVAGGGHGRTPAGRHQDAHTAGAGIDES
jgi:hypothetical protein